MEINQTLRQFAETIKEFKKTFNFSGLMVADAALYTQENLQYLGNIEWLTRVPLTVKAAQKLVREIDAYVLTCSQQEGYSYAEVKLALWRYRTKMVSY